MARFPLQAPARPLPSAFAAFGLPFGDRLEQVVWVWSAWPADMQSTAGPWGLAVLCVLYENSHCVTSPYGCG